MSEASKEAAKTAPRVRFAPSPTGELHVGGARTALFCYLFARRHAGAFILRVEDTDRERSTEAFVDAILEGMHWLQLDYDEGPFYQSGRMDRYAEVVQRLLDEEINPAVASHGGYISLVDVQEDIVYIRLEGGCQGCGMADVTLKQGIETAIIREMPDITAVRDVTDHAGGSNPYYQPSQK